MRVRAVLGSILGSVTVLVVGWQAGTASAHLAAITAANNSRSTPQGSSSPSTKTPASTPSATTSTVPGPASGSSSTGTKKTVVGSTVDTPFGPMQVEIVVASGKIKDVKALQVTNFGGRSVEISNYAVPILRDEVLAAQSANVNTVGGATYTSQGYLDSLQSALDKAHL